MFSDVVRLQRWCPGGVWAETSWKCALDHPERLAPNRQVGICLYSQLQPTQKIEESICDKDNMEKYKLFQRRMRVLLFLFDFIKRVQQVCAPPSPQKTVNDRDDAELVEASLRCDFQQCSSQDASKSLLEDSKTIGLSSGRSLGWRPGFPTASKPWALKSLKLTSFQYEFVSSQ